MRRDASALTRRLRPMAPHAVIAACTGALCIGAAWGVAHSRSLWREALTVPEAIPAPAAATPPTAPTAPVRNMAAGAGAHAVRRAMPTTPAPPVIAAAHGSALAATRTRLADGRSSPSREVDRWIVRLAGSGHSPATLARMRHYEPLIRGALAEHGVPEEMIALAWIESEFKPAATSRVGAAGIWQFMPGTARGYGLEVSHYVDERRDPVRATYAAARHLADLYETFGSWHTAAAAFNAGTGRVGGALRRTTGRGAGDDMLYWRARRALPRETREYVPKLLAAAEIAADPAAYGLLPSHTLPVLRFRQVRVAGGTSMEEVAHRTGTSPAAVRDLNPHLVRGITPPLRSWPVRIPVAAPTPNAAPTHIARIGLAAAR